MATFLRDGHTLLRDACPQCNSPLFKLKNGQIYCVSCDKRVIVIKDNEQVDNFLQNRTLEDITKVIHMKIKDIQQKLDIEKNTDELYKMAKLLLIYLESLEKLKNLKNT
jgi:UPF0148 protein